MLASSAMIGLLQGGADGVELAAEGGADAVDGSNDGNRDAGSDQTVFDRRGTGFVLEKRQNERLHGGSISVSFHGAGPPGSCQ